MAVQGVWVSTYTHTHQDVGTVVVRVFELNTRGRHLSGFSIAPVPASPASSRTATATPPGQKTRFETNKNISGIKHFISAHPSHHLRVLGLVVRVVQVCDPLSIELFCELINCRA